MALPDEIPDRFRRWFWESPAFLDYVQTTRASAPHVAAAEEQLGVRLPRAYVQMLQQQNGGYLRAAWPGCPSRCISGIGDQYPSITDIRAWWRPENSNGYEPGAAKLLIPFDGEGHWDVAFDYRECGPTGAPSVVFVDMDARSVTPLAPSFADYLNGLEDELSETCIRIYGLTTLPMVAGQLAAVLEVPGEAQGDFANGYPVIRFAFPDSEWAWLQPNAVPAGFRREGKRVITVGAALRFPEDPRCTVLLSFTDGVRDRVVEAVQTAGLQLVSPGVP